MNSLQPMTIDAMVTMFIEHQDRLHIRRVAASRRKLDTYRHAAFRFLDAIDADDATPGAVDEQTISRWWDAVAQRLEIRAARRELASVRAMLRWGIASGILRASLSADHLLPERAVRL